MKTALGKYTVETHPGLEMVDPNYEINDGTVDFRFTETFQPSITFIFGSSRIYHKLPPQPYVDGTWTDEDVANAVVNYLNEINQSK